MSDLNSPVKSSASLTTPSALGPMMVSSNASSVKEDIVTMTLKPSSPTTKKQNVSLKPPLLILTPQENTNTCIVESPPPNKKRISTDKSSISNPDTQTTPSLKTSQAALTLRGGGSRSFWRRASQAWSKKLWLPTKTGSVGSPGNTSNGCFQNTESISWSTVKTIKNIAPKRNSQQTSLTSSMCSLHGTTVKGGESLKQEHYQKRIKTLKKRKKNPPILKDFDSYIPSSRKYKLIPTESQRKTLNDWFASVRKIWNVCLNYIKINKIKPKDLDEYKLRNLFVIKKTMPEKFKKELNWTFRTPKRVREYAIKDLMTSYQSAETQLSNKQIKNYIIRPKSKIAKRQNICISAETSSIMDGMLKLSKNLSNIKIKSKEEKLIDGCLSNNSRIVREGDNYFVHIPKFIEPEEKDCIVTDKIISIDLGINIFGTFYNPDGAWGEIGLNVRDRLQTIYNKEKAIKHNKKMALKRKKRALQKCKEKIINLIDDFQWKMVQWILYHYKEVMLSRLYVRKTCPQLKRFFKDMRHCEFVDRLEYKSMFYNGRIIHEIKEYYTSSVCVKCGSMNVIKGKTIKCNKCGFEIHKDLSGSIGIFMAYL